MSMLLTMEILRVATLLSLFCFYSIFSFPTRPLNERSTELAWQAWLLVDDQNQNKQYDSESFTRRRITPKSVFIAPTFSPESLPACAEGYRPDSMGRCIKIIKLDEEAHLDFLLEKLNAQFGNYDEEGDDEQEEQEESQTSGPFQLNIPLNGGTSQEQTKDVNHGSLDIAIVVAPTNGNFGLDDNIKSTVKRTNFMDGSLQSQEKPPKLDNIPRPFHIYVNKPETTTQQEETTTIPSIRETTTLEAVTETIEQEFTESTLPTTSTFSQETTTQVQPDTTISDQHALFFLRPSLTNTEHVQNGTNNAEDTPVVASGDYSVISNDSLTTLLSNSTVINASVSLSDQAATDINKGQVQFKDPVDSGDLMVSEDFHSSSLVRFPTPEEDEVHRVDHIKYPEKVTQNHLLPHVNTNTYASRFQHILPPENPSNVASSQQFFDDYVHTRGADLKGNDRFVFKNPQTTFQDNLGSDPKTGEHKVHANHDRFQSSGDGGYDRVFNHRNRDKMWPLPSSWSESSPQKPIVLRFSRRSSNSRQLLEEHLRPHTQNSPTYYREVPSEDFSYIFGFDSNHDRRKNHR